MLDVARLGVLGAEKLPARRQIIEKRPHLDLGSRRFAAVAHRLDLPRRNRSPPSRRPPLFPESLGENATRSRCSGALRRESRASPPSPDRAAVRILLVACRSRQSNASSRSMPMPSSVTRMSEMPPRRIMTSIEPRLRIDAVLDQFLDHRSRPLDHLPRRHLAGERVGKKANAAHASLNFRIAPHDCERKAHVKTTVRSHPPALTWLSSLILYPGPTAAHSRFAGL